MNQEGHGGRMSFVVRDLLVVINAVLREKVRAQKRVQSHGTK